MERMTWMTEKRTSAPATGVPAFGCAAVAGTVRTGLQIRKGVAFAPLADGPGPVGGTPVTSHTNDHATLGRTAWDGTPLGSPGAGHG